MTIVQRLLLYITMSVVLSELDTISSIVIQFNIDPKVCMWIGFGDVWSNNLIEFFSFGFTVCLIATTYQKLRGKSIQLWGAQFCCKKYRLLVEVLYTALTIIFPLSYIWVPLYHQTYGLGQTVCVMRDCEPLNYSRIDSLSLQLVWLPIDFVCHSFIPGVDCGTCIANL